ncbi:MAG: GNAT family N-acetyltransferase [Pyrinomonadaceae bacterium]
MAVLQTIRNFFVPTSPTETEIIVPAPFTTYAIRSLSIRDLNTLLRLNLRCFRNGENYTKHTFNYLLTEPQSIGFAAVTPTGDMVGFILLMNNPNGSAHITTVGVAPEHRRRGVAESLIARVDNALRDREISTIVLEVRVGNFAAQRLYQATGYSIVQRMNHYYHNGEDGYLMMKSLI